MTNDELDEFVLGVLVKAGRPVTPSFVQNALDGTGDLGHSQRLARSMQRLRIIGAIRYEPGKGWRVR